jgi:pimeloyl-ACP methyl ester carboxylesterase
MTVTARLHDGAAIDVQVAGSGPALLIPVNPVPVEGERADELRQWGVDPALGRTLMDGLADVARVVAFDYEGHVQAVPKAGTLTPDNLVADLHAIADAAGADEFAYYGYSWLGLAGIQLAIRSSRLVALSVGGFPPIDGPYREMLEVTRAAHRMAIEPATSPPPSEPAPEWNGNPDDYDWDSAPFTLTADQTRQFVTLYEALEGFDDRAAQSRITSPRLCFTGGRDDIDYGERWGNVRVEIGSRVVATRAELERLGWTVHVLDGMDHTQAMQPGAVLPVIRPWLAEVLAGAAATS